MATQSQGHIAYRYASKGIKVFPCNPKDKSPLTRNGFKDASNDIAQINRWWDEHPDALIGSPCDQEKFMILDVDNYNIPTEAEWIINGVLSSLKEKSIISDDSLRVTTRSGGTHYYFKHSDGVGRSIGILPQMDLLGAGGYTILADQRNYIANEDEPWEHFRFLPELKIKALTDLAESIHTTTKHVKKIVKEYRKTESSASDETASDVYRPEKPKYNTDMEQYRKVRDETPEANIGAIDYESEEIYFDIKDGIYTKSEKDFKKFDGKAQLLDQNGQIQIEEGSLDSELIMQMFYNQEIQKKLCNFMDLPVPGFGKGESCHSVLPKHRDDKKSMGVRWHEDQTHIIVRDFSNHFNDIYEQTDFNLVRLFAIQRYKTNVPRLGGPEFVTWFLRMLVDANIVNVNKHMTTPQKNVSDLRSESRRKMMESILMLEAIKKLHSKWDGTFVFADKFSAAWSGIPVGSVNRTKKALIGLEYIKNVGVYNCVPGRADGFFNTKVYEVIKRNPKMIITGLGDIKMRLAEVTQKREEKERLAEAEAGATTTANIPRRDAAGTSDKEKHEDAINDKYPDLTTHAGLMINSKDYKKLKHFAEDYDIPNVPLNENMMIPMYISSEYQDLEPINESEDTTYFADQLQLTITEGNFGNKVLMVEAVSPAIDELIEETMETDGNDNQEAGVAFVLSYDVTESADDIEENKSFYESKLNEYVQHISSNKFDIRHLPEDQLLQLMDGMTPMKED